MKHFFFYWSQRNVSSTTVIATTTITIIMLCLLEPCVDPHESNFNLVGHLRCIQIEFVFGKIIDL